MGRLAVDTERPRQFAQVDRRPLLMGQHGAEAPQQDGRDRNAPLQQMAFHLAGDEILTPLPGNHFTLKLRNRFRNFKVDREFLRDFLEILKTDSRCSRRSRFAVISGLIRIRTLAQLILRPTTTGYLEWNKTI